MVELCSNRGITCGNKILIRTTCSCVFAAVDYSIVNIPYPGLETDAASFDIQ